MTVGLGWMCSSSRAGRMFWHNGGTGGFRSFAGFLYWSTINEAPTGQRCGCFSMT
jgi:hypothetical protein